MNTKGWTATAAHAANTEGILIKDAKNRNIAVLTGPWSLEEEEELAYLIVAAPELLERCSQALEALNMLGGSDEIVALLEQTIAKAKGG